MAQAARQVYNNASEDKGSPKIKGHRPSLIHNYARQAQSPAAKFTASLCEALGLDPHKSIVIGPTKTRESIRRKTMSQCGGNTGKVKDPCRFTIEFDNAADIPKIIRLANYHDKTIGNIIKKSKGKFQLEEAPRDRITNPKRWGYMGMYLIMSTTSGKGNHRIPFEIQIVHSGMRKEIYPETHKLYEQIKDSLEEWEKQNSGKHTVSIHDVLNKDEIDIVQQILNLHELGAWRYGLMDYIDGDFPRLEDPAPAEHEYEIRPDGDQRPIAIPGQSLDEDFLMDLTRA